MAESDHDHTEDGSAKKKVKLTAPDGLGDHPTLVIQHRPTPQAVPAGIMQTLYANTPKPKVLEYFSLQALGELPRLLLEATSTPYDAVYHFDSKMFKAYAPFGQLPLYRGDELEGNVLSQSGAISRHIARFTSIDGKSVGEKARVDQLFELSQDLSSKKAGLHDPKNTAAPRLFSYLDAAERLAPRLDGNEYWVGHSLTLADVAMFRVLKHFSEIKDRSLSSYPKLEGFVTKFALRPEIARYLDSDRRVPLTKNEIGDAEWHPDGYKYITPLSDTFVTSDEWVPPPQEKV